MKPGSLAELRKAFALCRAEGNQRVLYRICKEDGRETTLKTASEFADQLEIVDSCNDTISFDNGSVIIFYET